MNTKANVIARLLSEDAAAPYFESSDPTDNCFDGRNVVMRGQRDGIPFRLVAVGASGQYALAESAVGTSHQ
ncbi:hypothetical protein [Tanticharoenia sakaeratensis]|uniref:Uncharacterized protein n=1 Tax=Tanticharoenia sakaeratensis NBRC 103193 TaxID=1231623 RepID=A0A0D6MN30_9PROT|nr:hypothetical protein [Tanticharoenia sakaeratensis]GAN54841.1 hypothetical protein Tasa_031_059 [Tanticharoenia sakaeratensis NBRC 103193]GBQ21396.1 hypothetical protein AA103193_1714 [Tanticharoenia sakaeratensis NBRC 103193]